jgi:UDP-N-acetylmuramoyl-L-alanyl-D-glutamate--2,6-diaminopimelate ligase
VVSVALRPRSPRTTSLSEVAACAGASTVPTPRPDVRVSGVTLDSRAVQPGDLYAALPGARVHGAAFGADVVARGAVAVLTDAEGAELLARAGVAVPAVVVPQPRAVLGSVAALVHGSPAEHLRMVGITGTNGKTTTAYLLDSAWRALGHVTGLVGTVETRVADERVKSVRTTPESPDLHALLAVMRERGVDTCTMEVSSHALELHRVDPVVYDVAAFTNLSQDHLDFHGTMERYYAAKASLFTPQRARQGVVCVDDAWGQRLAAEATVPVVTVTSRPDVDADWRVRPAAGGGGRFDLVAGSRRLLLRSALPGDFNQLNTAVAALVLAASGVADEDIVRAVHAEPHVPGRMERVLVEGDGAPLAVVDFAHTADAVSAALGALRPQTTGALIAVLGAGGDRDPGKRRAMGAAAATCADVVVVTDDNPRSEDPAAIRAEVLAGARSVDAARTPSGAGTGTAAADLREVGGRAAAIRAAVALAGPGDTVAVLGKGHETGQEVHGTVHPFDDRDELRAALTERTRHHHKEPTV